MSFATGPRGPKTVPVSLRTRLTLIVVGLTTAAIFLTATLFGLISLHTALDQIDSESQLLARLVARSATAGGGLKGDGGGLDVPPGTAGLNEEGVDDRTRTLLSLLDESRRVEGIWLFDRAMTPLFASPAEGLLSNAALSLTRRVLASGESESFVTSSFRILLFIDAPTVYVAGPVTGPDGRQDGVVLIRLNTTHLIAPARTQFILAIILCALLVILDIVIARSVVGRATRSLDVLAADMTRLADDYFRPDETLKQSLERLKKGRYREVSTLAGGFSTLLERLETYIATLKETSSEKRVIEGELSAARTIQMGLLPHTFDLPTGGAVDLFAIVEPAKAVGGDLYDTFMIDDKHLFFVIGDVSDKGVPAALFMAMTKTLLGALVRQNPQSLEQALEQVNMALIHNNPEGMFVTLLAGVLDLDSGVVTYADAGHEPAIRLGADDGVAHCIEKVGGEPLGIFPDATYRTGVISLKPGDGLLLYTDGVTEAMDARRRQYSNQRLERTLTPLARRATARALIDTVLADVHAYAGEEAQSDDIALLALRWQRPSKD